MSSESPKNLPNGMNPLKDVQKRQHLVQTEKVPEDKSTTTLKPSWDAAGGPAAKVPQCMRVSSTYLGY